MSVPYPFARGPQLVRMIVEMQRKTTTLWNTIGILHGSIPGQELVLGAQRDAWVYGIGAGGGGTVTLLEAARGLGYLAHTGWVPGRTIVLAAWDGEELGSYGSLAYLKRHGDEIRSSSIAYLNTEPSVTGPTFGADAVAAIAQTIGEASHVVPDPARPGGGIVDLRSLRVQNARHALPPIDRGNGGADIVRTAALVRRRHRQALNADGFSGPFGPYHSSYDTLQFAKTISDPQVRPASRDRAAVRHRRAAPGRRRRGAVSFHLVRRADEFRPARARGARAYAPRQPRHARFRRRDQEIRRQRGASRRGNEARRNPANAAADRELEAARILDLTAYGIDGDTGITFPDVVRAIREGDQNAVDLAAGRARTTLDRSGSLIAS